MSHRQRTLYPGQSRTLSEVSRKMKAVRRIDELDLRRLHKLRLRAKRMRYTIEFTRSLYKVNPKRIEGMLKQLGKLQTALGKLTDMASARTILSRIAVEAKADPKSAKLGITSQIDNHSWRSRKTKIQTIEEGCQSI